MHGRSMGSTSLALKVKRNGYLSGQSEISVAGFVPEEEEVVAVAEAGETDKLPLTKW